MAENELLDLPKHNSWRRARQLLHSGADADEVAQECSGTVDRILGKLPKPLVRELLSAARAGKIAYLNEFIRDNYGVKAEFATLVRDASWQQLSHHSDASLARVVALMHRRWLEQFRALAHKLCPNNELYVDEVYSQARARLQRDFVRHVSALQPDRFSPEFPKTNRPRRPRFELSSSLLDKTLAPIRGHQINESARGNR